MIEPVWALGLLVVHRLIWVWMESWPFRTQATDEAVSFLAVFAAYEKLIALEPSTPTWAGSTSSWQPSGH